jgi:hypothetical protein
VNQTQSGHAALVRVIKAHASKSRWRDRRVLCRDTNLSVQTNIVAHLKRAAVPSATSFTDSTAANLFLEYIFRDEFVYRETELSGLVSAHGAFSAEKVGVRLLLERLLS